jgi:hypothetical protein
MFFTLTKQLGISMISDSEKEISLLSQLYLLLVK